ncbi:MAG: gfo/Idh/MocA family oxidoreductase, partial [Chitinophagaceae bacterium]
SHQIDFINWAFNTHPDEITGAGGIDYYKDGRETYDNVQAILRYNKAGMIGNFGATCANEREGYVFQLKGTKGTVSLLVDDGIFYPEKETRKQLETVDGVTGATKIEWNKDGGIPIMKEKLKDGTWYALQEFYKVITEKTTPVSNVITGARTACCVHMINSAIYKQRIEKWKPEYNIL